MGRDREEVGTSIHCRGFSPETCVMYSVNYILPQCYISSGAATDGEDSHSPGSGGRSGLTQPGQRRGSGLT